MHTFVRKEYVIEHSRLYAVYVQRGEREFNGKKKDREKGAREKWEGKKKTLDASGERHRKERSNERESESERKRE